jgi:non-ribosomal peptide synthetase component F
MVEHGGVVNCMEYFSHELGVSPKSAVLGLTTFCFDISVLEVFLALTNGARLVLVSSASQKDGRALMSVIERSGVSIVQATPSTFEMLLGFGWQGSRAVDVLCGGEAFRLSLSPLVTASR